MDRALIGIYFFSNFLYNFFPLIFLIGICTSYSTLFVLFFLDSSRKLLFARGHGMSAILVYYRYENIQKHFSSLHSKDWPIGEVSLQNSLSVHILTCLLVIVFFNLFILSKGHYISEAKFLVVIWTKKRKKCFLEFCPKGTFTNYVCT